MPASTMLYLLRHADSTVSSDMPESDWPLTQVGKKQAQALANRLAGCQIDAIYSSPQVLTAALWQQRVPSPKPMAYRFGPTTGYENAS